MSTITREMLNIPSHMLRTDEEMEEIRKQAFISEVASPAVDTPLFKGRNPYFDCCLPPIVQPWEPGYAEYMKKCKNNSDQRNRELVLRRPEFGADGRKTGFMLKIDLESKINDGFVEQLDEHMKIWEEPCLIRLSDVLKQTERFKTSFTEYKRYEKSTNPERVACRRHYALPHSHREDPDCDCIFCRACIDTLWYLSLHNETEENLVLGMIDKIRQRTTVVLVSHVKMAFGEDPYVGLDERICYGFRSALPPLVITHFEQLFKGLYNIGADLCWEIIKRLGLLIKYTPDYSSAYQFLTFWVECIERLEQVIQRLENDMDCFNWKLKEYNISLKTFFFHFVHTMIADLVEFQEAMRICKEIVQTQRLHHPVRLEEVSSTALGIGLFRAEGGLIEARIRWNNHTLPFVLEEQTVPKYNVFKISRLRNPYVRVPPNIVEGYEVVRCKISGAVELAKLEPNVHDECEFGEPVLDLCVLNPKDPTQRFRIRVLRKEDVLSPIETEQFARNCEANFLMNQGVKVCVQFGGARSMDMYLDHRYNRKLDKVEGDLPADVEEIVTLASRGAARAKAYEKKGFPVAKRVKPRKPARPHCIVRWPPVSPRVRQRKPMRNLKPAFDSPKLDKHCRRGTKCHLYECSSIPRHRYSFGGIPFPRDTRAGLMEIQNFDFLSEVLSTALQLGTGHIDPLGEDDDTNINYRYFVMYEVIDANIEQPDELETEDYRLGTEHDPAMYRHLCEIINLHYDALHKYELITPEDSLSSPHIVEAGWAEAVLCNRRRGEKFVQRVPELNAVVIAEYKNKGPSSAAAKRKAGEDSAKQAEACKQDSSRSKAGAGAAKSKGESEEDMEHLVAISEDGEIVAFGTRVSPPPPEPKKRPIKEKRIQPPQPSRKNMATCRCPRGHGEMSHSVTLDGTLHVEATLDMGGMCGREATGHGATPNAARAQQPTSGNQSKSGTNPQQRPSRPGLPVSVGYAEKRNDLRQKLESQKQELKSKSEKSNNCSHERTHPISTSANIVSRKTKKETVVFTTTKPPTDDLDELVSLIEGTPINNANGSRKGSLTGDMVDPKKAAKKLRKKVRKEEQRLEEEAARLAEEQRLIDLEEERLRKLKEEEEELARKKREKKRQKKKRRKQDKSPETVDEVESEDDRAKKQPKCPDGSGSKQNGKKKNDQKKNEQKKNEPTKKLDEKKQDIHLNSSAIVNDPRSLQTVTSRNQKQVDGKQIMPATKSDDNPIVTIRRHSNTPDANVTISVKGDNGEEDILYTLVNGKVLRAENAGKPSSSPVVNTQVGKKKRKGKCQDAAPEVGTSTGGMKQNGVVIVENPNTLERCLLSSFPKANSNSIPMTKMENQGSQSIDVNKLNLPSGLIITRLDDTSYPNAQDDSEWEKVNVTRIDNRGRNAATGSYSSNYRDSTGFNQQVLYSGKDAGPEDFEEVVSNKKRRLRNKANKVMRDGEEEADLFSQHRDSNGSLELKMMDLSIGNSPSNQNLISLSRKPDESPSQCNPMSQRSKRYSPKSQDRGMLPASTSNQRPVNGQTKGSTNLQSNAVFSSREPTPNVELISSYDGVNGQGGKYAQGGVFAGGQTQHRPRQVTTRGLYIPRHHDEQARKQSWSTTNHDVDFDGNMRRASDGFGPSHNQQYYEKPDYMQPSNGGWHPMNAFQPDCRQVSLHPIEASGYAHNIGVQPGYPHGDPTYSQHARPPQRRPGQFSGQYHPYQPYQFESPQPQAQFGEYKQHGYNDLQFGNEPGLFHPNKSSSPFSPRLDGQQSSPFASTGDPWTKPTSCQSTAPGGTFASVLKRIENDAKEPAFGPFMTQAERATGSPWAFGGDSDRSGSGSGGARPSPDPEVFFHNTAVGAAGSGVTRYQYGDDANNSSSRAQSCDSALIGGVIGSGLGSPSPYQNIQNPIRRPTPTSPFTFGQSPVEQTEVNFTSTGSPIPNIPDWDASKKLGTFWNSHK